MHWIEIEAALESRMFSHNDDYLFRGDLTERDPDVAQVRKLIMIPSESSVPQAVREVIGSALTNVYAEGYPNPESCWLTEDEILDHERYLAHHRRYGDRRYYQGVEYANVLESLARRRCAEAFATDCISADQICVNVQPLSGAPANTAVMQALLEPGDTFMAMALPHGGHLTHGDPVNVSGRYYKVVPYEVDRQTEMLDYDAIEALALEHRPKLIIAGYTSYPRQPDWARFRQIADRAGAYLMADIAHTAGLVIAGAHPNPVGHAHVVTFTTHKTLCGPRGACILTTDSCIARKFDRAVFPGLQGGPHVNKFAAMAVAFKLAQTEQFRRLQHQIVANAAALADALTARGMRLPCGGTDTHLLLIDCKTTKAADGTPLMGHTAASILELIGIVGNKQKIPGDESAFYPSGVRLGTPWVTQRGLREPEMARIADIISRAIKAIEPFTYAGRRGPRYRGKIDFDLLEELRVGVSELAEKAGVDLEPPSDSCPSHYLVLEPDAKEGPSRLVEIRGPSAAAFVEQITPTDVSDLAEEWRRVTLLERDGRVMSPALARRCGTGHDCYQLLVPVERARRVVAWLRDLSDGFVIFDDADIWAKLPGPVVVRDVGATDEMVPEGEFEPPVSCKPYFVGLSVPSYDEPAGEPLPSFDELRTGPFGWQESEEQALRRTPLYDWHVAHGAKMAPFAGWEMPLWYTSIGDEHRAVREAVGLFDVSHMGILEARGPHAAYFLNLVTSNDASRLHPGETQYAYLLSPDGRVIDDVMIYSLAPERYMVVVNAANAAKDWAWLRAVNERRVCIDDGRPWACTGFQTELRNLHDSGDPGDELADLALQGPRSLEILLALLDATPAADGAPSTDGAALAEVATARSRLLTLAHAEVMEARVPSARAPGGAFDLIIARTGYTGEPMGFEIFVHPGVAIALWEQLMALGGPLGLQPVGLGARDSLRVEAGLPLYGHELAGPLDLRPDDAGFAAYVKLHKPFFVGRRAYIAHAQERAMAVVRFRIGRKGVRVPNLEDVVVDNHGRVIGQVTSCSMGTDGLLVGQACIERRRAKVGEGINIFPHPTREHWDKPYDELEMGDRLVLHSEATIVSRFLRR
jgi:glycine hydroxymethyltransferase